MIWLLAAALLAQDGFAAISADTIASGEIDMSNPVFTTLTGTPPNICPLDRSQIAEAIAILKRARPEPKTLKSIPRDLLFHFALRDGSGKIHAVIGASKPGEGARIFFAGQQAVLDETGHAALRRMAVNVGCGTLG